MTVDFDLDFDPLQTEPSLTPWPAANPDPDADASGLRTQPLMRSQSRQRQGPRVLVVSTDFDERMYLRARLAIAGLVWMDEATTTTQAISAMADGMHVLVFMNLDSPVIDAWALVEHLLALNPKAKPVATTAIQEQDTGWKPLRHWQHSQVYKKAMAAGFHDLLIKPIQVKSLTQIISRVTVNVQIK